MGKFKSVLLFAMIYLLPGLVFAQNTPSYIITHYDSASSGYYFICPFKLGIIPGAIYSNHMILDSTGNLVYYKSFPNGTNTSDFKLQSNGFMSYSFQGKHFIMDSTFAIVDSVNCVNGISSDVHDFQMLPNGHFLLLGIEEVIMDLSSYYFFGPNNNASGSTNAHVKCAVIQELDAAKNVVFEWHANDYFSFTDVDTSHLQGPNNVDWTHSNSIELDNDGNILLSSRHFNEITKIDRQTGAVIWRLGGNKNQFTFLNDTMKFKRQHDARRLSNGNLTLFDNGNGMLSGSFHFASAKEYQLDETALTAELVWSYVDDSSEFSTAMGNFQRMPGENSVIGYGMSDTQTKVFSAVDDFGNKVFQMEFVLALNSYRSFNYKQLPWNINRPVISCFENNGQLYLDAGSGYGSYLWSTGDTTQIISVTLSDTFFVFVPYGDGGFVSSEWLTVDNPLTFCDISSYQYDDYGLGIFVINPVKDEIVIFTDDNKENSINITISDVSGKVIHSMNYSIETQIKVPFEHFAIGIYFVKINSKVIKIVKF